MILSKLSIKRPVLITVFTIALVILGIQAYFKMPLNMMPDATIPVITVQVIYPGAGPEEIESNITKKIEDEVVTVSGLDYVQSFVMENATQIVCFFKMDKNIDIANQEVKDKIDAIISRFPKEAEAPVIMKYDINAEPVVYLSYTSSLNPGQAYEFADKQIKERLSRIQGVSQVELKGGQEREVQIILDRHKLDKYLVSPLQLVEQLQINNLVVPGGNIKRQGSEYSIKVDAEFKSLDDIRNLKITTPTGVIKLGELAVIQDSRKKAETIARFANLEDKNSVDGSTAINMNIKKQSDANTVDVAALVKKEVAKINATLPDGQRLQTVIDNSTFVKDSVDDTVSAIWQGILLTALLLYLFLHNYRSTIIVAVSMPITLIATLLLAKYSGFSLNIMSLMALSVSVGTLVTNSVVILENIDRYIGMGMSKKEAADKGTAEIAVAVIASTVTNVVVFVPIATMESMVGQFFKEFGLTVTFVMIFSILISFTITPMLSALLLKDLSDEKANAIKKKGFGVWFDSWFDRFSLKYRKVLAASVKTTARRIGMIIFSFVVLAVSLVWIGPKLGGEFIPVVNQGDVEISVELPSYYSLDKTAEVFTEIEKRIKTYPEIKTLITTIGNVKNTTGTNLGYLKVKIKDSQIPNTAKFVAEVSQTLADVPGANIKVAAINAMGQGDGGAQIQFQVYGQDSKELEIITKQVYEILKNTKGALNVDTDLRSGKPEVIIIPNRQKMSDYGVSSYQLALTVRSAIEGLTASKYKQDGEEYDIRIKLQDEDINDLEKVKNLLVLTKYGNIKVSDLGAVKYGTAPTMITRKNKNRMNNVTASASGVTPGEITAAVNAGIKEKIQLPEGYRIDTAGDAEMMADSNKDFSQAFILAIILTFLLIAGILESFTQATLIMFTVPLAFIGVLWSLLLSGESLNIFSMMAGVMLIGIVVNNAILIQDYANQLMSLGQTKMEAMLEACQTKLKAIIMATLASVLGMLPLALGLGSGAELRQGMGIVSIGGLLVGSVLTQFIIPALYIQFVKNKQVFDHDND